MFARTLNVALLPVKTFNFTEIRLNCRNHLEIYIYKSSANPQNDYFQTSQIDVATFT